jgi:hypothetical protein
MCKYNIIMTLKEAQKMYSDAILTKVTHKPFSITGKDLIQLGQHWDTPAGILYIKIGKCSSRVISSRQAYIEEQRNHHRVKDNSENPFQEKDCNE